MCSCYRVVKHKQAVSDERESSSINKAFLPAAPASDQALVEIEASALQWDVTVLGANCASRPDKDASSVLCWGLDAPLPRLVGA